MEARTDSGAVCIPDQPRPAHGRPAAAPRRRRASRLWMPALVVVLEALAVSAAFFLAYLLRFHCAPLLELAPPPGGLIRPWSWFSGELVAIVPVWIFFHYLAGLYKEDLRSFEDEALAVAQACLFGSMATLAVGFLYHRFESSRLMILLAFPIAAGLVLAVRQLAKRGHSRLLELTRGQARILILGNGRTGQMLRKRLEGQRRFICFSLAKGAVPEVLEAVSREGISQVILSQMDLEKTQLLRLAEECERRGVELKIVPGLLELRMGEVQVDQTLGVPTLTLYHSSFSEANFAVKRMIDLAICAAVMALGAIPFAAIACLIKLDSRGPVLYKQKRHGYKGRVFEAYKFRTMQTGAESRVEALRTGAAAGPYFKIKSDPRITRVGRWLRRFSLDEFPQFINVCKGEMSVVGPRPLAVSSGELEALESSYGESSRKVLNVVPGITGLWQVSGRSELNDDARFALDLYYIEHWSPGLDLKIILKTPGAVFSSRGAY